MHLQALDEGFWLGMVGWVFIVIGLIFVRVTIAKVHEDLASRRWPEAIAALKHAEAATSTQPVPSGSDRPAAVQHGVRLQYEYRVGEAVHSLHDWHPAKRREEAERIAAAQTIGATRTIVYDPDDPSYYLLARPARFAGLVWLLPFAAFAGFGALVIYVGSTLY